MTDDSDNRDRNDFLKGNGHHTNSNNGRNGHKDDSDSATDPEQASQPVPGPGDPGGSDDGPLHDPSLDTPEEFIPTGDELLDAALKALHEEVAFILMHRPDEPETFAEHLGRLIDRLQAVITIKGPHRARAIRMLLSIEAKYWMAAYKFSEWGELLNFMYSIVRDMKDPALLSDFMEIWGIYYTLNHWANSAMVAFEWSEELATSLHENRGVLSRIEHFNNEVMKLTSDEALSQATAMLALANVRDSTYFQARIYHSLARHFRFKGQENEQARKDAFMYGQQALCYYLYAPEDWVLVAQLITTLFASIDPRNSIYRERLIAYQERVTQRTNFNPWLRAKTLHSYGALHYDNGDYPQARAYGLRAWWQHQRLGDLLGCAMTRHVVGLAQREMERWKLAEWHLKGALALYDRHGESYYYVRAHIALATLPYRQRQWGRALNAFKEAQRITEERLQDRDIRQGLLDEINDYLHKIRQHLAEN